MPRKENKVTPEKRDNRRERKIKQIRKEVRTLRKQLEQASTGEKEGIKELTASLHEQLIRIRRTEGFKMRQKKEEAARAQFIKDPYRLTKSHLGQTTSGNLTSFKTEMEQFVEKIFSDPSRDKALEGDHGHTNVNLPPSAQSVHHGERFKR